MGVVRIRLRVNRHFAIVRHGPCGPALSPGRVLHGFAVGSQGCVPQEDVLVWDGVAFGDAVAFAVGDGAVEGVWVGVGWRAELGWWSGLVGSWSFRSAVGWLGKCLMPLLVDGLTKTQGSWSEPAG